MGKRTPGKSSRKPPEPSDSHAEIDDWMRRVMPDLNPVVKRVDEMIRQAHEDLQYAVKWRKAYYGLLGGARFDSTPPLGEGDDSRYVKVKTVEEVDTPEMRAWIEEAGRVEGWR